VSRLIAQRELRNQNAKILDAVAAGASFIVTRNGEPIAELRPVTHGRRPLVAKAQVAAVAAQGPHLDAAAFRRDLDDTVDQQLPT
jgi:prevent-host-death family protein